MGLLRDPATHANFFVDYDNTRSPTTEVYISGVRIETTGDLGSHILAISNTVRHRIGEFSGTASAPDHKLFAILAEFMFFDCDRPAVSDIGLTDVLRVNAYGQWVHKAFAHKGDGADAYGANGFHLDFADPLDLGKDTSGNGNHFTAVGLTVDQQVIDTPTNNFCVLNPLVPSGSSSLSSGNLRVTSSGVGGTYGTLRVSRGVYKIEACFNTALDFSHIGWQDAANGRILGGTGMVNTYLRSDGDVFIDGVVVANVGQIAAGSYIGVRLDLDAGTVSYFRNGDPLSGPHAISSARGWTPMVTVGPSSGVTIDLNCGQKPFVYDIAPDALAVCTANGACPAILKPDDYFTTRLVGDSNPLPWNALTGKTLAVTKDRNSATGWRVNDTVRGDGKAWACDVGGAEINEGATGVTWTADGPVYGSAAEYQGNRITWFWRASPKAGFDIVGPINHVTGSQTPFTQLSGGVIEYAWLVPLDGGDCRVYHHALPAGAYYTLNSEPGSAVDAGWFSSTASALTIGAQMPTGRYVAYVWRSVPQFSDFGVMPSNGTVDGPFWSMDFLPRVAMLRNYTTGGNTYDHFVWGHGENTNPATQYLMTNLPDTERQSAILDLVTNGIKVRTNTPTVNPAGSALIPYAAWAQTPGKFARVR
ncbi:DUF7483 domain-containing protein [Thalassospira alkalitolerans]|uniref:B30.2/SPRY domain-containing protein n=1 Tax=Thalassospira alkalitolerans TaxID=1293890 RepID=A0A1Y2LF31_9PROT|nr:hypothetical protein [Thalassospira alkalitolerans]OSQ49611.1 hypothetical protein TALK_04615 [Thalassospira alkalitolerans]